MAGRDDRHLSMRARNATTRLTEYTATRVRYKARYIRKSSHTVRSGSSVHWGPEQFTRLAAGTGTSLARRQFVSLPRKQTVSSLLVTYPNIQGRRCRYASRHRTHHSWPMWKGGEGGSMRAKGRDVLRTSHTAARECSISWGACCFHAGIGAVAVGFASKPTCHCVLFRQ